MVDEQTPRPLKTLPENEKKVTCYFNALVLVTFEGIWRYECTYLFLFGSCLLFCIYTFTVGLGWSSSWQDIAESGGECTDTLLGPINMAEQR